MQYAKALVALLVSAAGALVTALGPGNSSLGDLSTQTWLIALATILGSTGIVWFCENVPGVAGSVFKTIVAFLSAGVPSLVTALDDHVITQGEWLTAFIAAVTATGLVYQTKNAGDNRFVAPDRV